MRFSWFAKENIKHVSSFFKPNGIFCSDVPPSVGNKKFSPPKSGGTPSAVHCAVPAEGEINKKVEDNTPPSGPGI